MRPEDRQVLEALDEVRAAHPDLADLLAFYADLRAAQCRAKAQIEPPRRTLDEAEARRRMLEGQPQLDYSMLWIEEAAFADLVETIASVLRTRGDPRLESAVHAWDPQALVSLAREVFEGRVPPDTDQPRPERVAVELALVPYLEVAAEHFAPHLDASLWHHPHCPVCGGPPDLALLGEADGARQLVCSRCGAWWRFPRLECPFCRTVDQNHLRYYPSEDGLYRLYVCELCKRYLKTVDLRKARRKVLPTVERIVTIGMDVAARERGYQG